MTCNKEQQVGIELRLRHALPGELPGRPLRHRFESYEKIRLSVVTLTRLRECNAKSVVFLTWPRASLPVNRRGSVIVPEKKAFNTPKKKHLSASVTSVFYKLSQIPFRPHMKNTPKPIEWCRGVKRFHGQPLREKKNIYIYQPSKTSAETLYTGPLKLSQAGSQLSMGCLHCKYK